MRVRWGSKYEICSWEFRGWFCLGEDAFRQVVLIGPFGESPWLNQSPFFFVCSLRTNYIADLILFVLMFMEYHDPFMDPLGLEQVGRLPKFLNN